MKKNKFLFRILFIVVFSMVLFMLSTYSYAATPKIVSKLSDAFDDIESAIKDNASVILVDVTGVNDGGEFVYAFRWYEAPKGLDSSYAG